MATGQWLVCDLSRSFTEEFMPFQLQFDDIWGKMDFWTKTEWVGNVILQFYANRWKF